ncbi:CpmK protein [Klebsiella sp. BIGb0407]|uniref:CpmK protein n=1 Tax=Klebsiella sp. BIGb0407 TaxID=2940603 RepID=UPI00216AADE8|nr:CpmK protein [Klebsiella sp. BIGb0407]MCS3429713.1 hypothetical protein [Klebsiella sp. BIGb0407]
MKSALFILLLMLPGLSYSNQKPYAKLIQQALDKQPPLCLGELQWPVSMAQGESAWVYARMAALMEVGLVTDKGQSATKQWSLTPQGKKEFNKKNDFCYGTIRVNQIEKIIKNDDGTLSVIFDYRIENLPEWATAPAIRGAYSDVDNLVTGIKNARYQADFARQASGAMAIIGEPYQLDLFY